MTSQGTGEEGGGTHECPIRPFHTLEEYRECVALQERVWGAGFSERVPVAILKVSRRLGGVAAGAYDEAGTLAGFVFGMTGLEDGRPVHWSDMLAVRPGLRDTGLGTRLKLYQREVLLERGIDRVYWSFDPLESRNAYLNLEHLGVVAREYQVDMYGESDSPLHRGMGTDRFIARWELDSARVKARVEGGSVGSDPRGPDGAGPAVAALDAAESEGDLPAPGEPVVELEAPVISVAIPASVQDVKAADTELARRWRRATRRVFRHYLDRGWEVRGLERAGNISRYRLVRDG